MGLGEESTDSRIHGEVNDQVWGDINNVLQYLMYHMVLEVRCSTWMRVDSTEVGESVPIRLREKATEQTLLLHS